MIVLTSAVVLPMIQKAGFDLVLVRHLHRAAGRDRGGDAAGGLQPVRAAEHDRARTATRSRRRPSRSSCCLVVCIVLITVFPQIVTICPTW
jgi:hypothetical protein